jgi:type II secretory pathway component GspD/PulD (secretin)
MIFVCGRMCGVRRIAISLFVLACIIGAVTAAQASQGVMLDVRKARLGDVVTMLMQQSGVNIAISPEAAEKEVTAIFDGVPVETALSNILTAAGVDYWKTKDGTYIVGGKKPEEPVVTPASQEPVTTPAPTPDVKKPLKTEIVKLVNLHPNDVLKAIGLMTESEYNSTLLGMKYGGNLGILDEDRFQTGIRVPGNEPRSYQNTGTPNGLSGINGGEVVPPAVDGGNLSQFNKEGAGRTADASTGSSQYYPRTTPGTTPVTAPRTTGTTTTGTAGTNTLLPDGVDMVMPFASDNSLIIRGTEEGIAAFKDLVYLLDVPPKQVQIKAEFVEVSTDDVKRLGVDWSLERLNTTINTNFNPSGNVVVGFTSGNLAASLRTELTSGNGKIINSPIISTINNQYAEISIGSVIPYWTTVLVSAGNGQLVQSTQVNQLTIQSYLRVLPRVNGDNTITLQLMPSVQDTGRIYKDPTGQSEIPETRYQTLSTMRRVANGETIVVGGFIYKKQDASITRVPLLSDLPLIGPLFRSKDVTGQDKELLIFVTPTIIGEKASGTSVGVSPTP